MKDQLTTIVESVSWVIPEIILAAGFMILIVAGLFKVKRTPLLFFSIGIFITVFVLSAKMLYVTSPVLFGMLRVDGISSFIKILVNLCAVLTCLLPPRKNTGHTSEYFAFLMSVVLGAHLLVMTTNFLMVFVSIEVISISSYVLAGYSFDKRGAEGSLKYFLFGSVAAAVMLYGFSLLYGLSGSLDFASQAFIEALINKQDGLSYLAIVFVAAGLLFKMSSAPMHFWAPDVYDAAPVPVIAFFSTVPKLAGLTIFLKFFVAMNLFGQAIMNWQSYAVVIAILTITVGNFAALKQTRIKRMMAYSSIAQSGFLMIGLIVLLPQGIGFFLFYSAVYCIGNFLVFLYVNSLEKTGATTIAEYAGYGKVFALPTVFMLIGLISLTGLPPTAGFSGKLFLFSAVWSSIQHTNSTIMVVLLITGLLNTVVSLFFYLRIPYYAFLKSGKPAISHNILPLENLLGAILVVVLLILFFQPGLLMSWINKINFVL